MAREKSAKLHAVKEEPKVIEYIGPVDSEAMIDRSMKHYPLANGHGVLYNASRWLDAVAWLRKHSKNGWSMDRRTKP